jgi:hypothetical protein
MQLVEKSTNRIVDVPDEEVQAKFQSGMYGFPADQRIPVLNREGTPGTIAAQDAQQAFSKGFTIETSVAREARQREAQYGGVGGTLAATGEALARGATVGLSDPLAIAVADALGGSESAEKVRTHLKEAKEAHPYLSTGAELVGAVAPILATGGAAAPEVGAAEVAGLAGETVRATETVASTARAVEQASALGRIAELASGAGRIATTPARGVAAAGKLTEKAIAAVAGDASASTVAKIVQKALARGAGASVEGALYGAGNQISEDALGNHELTADKMLAAIGHGAIVGALLGTGAEVSTTLVSTAAQTALEKASPLLKRLSREEAFKSLSYGGLSPTRLVRAADRVGGKAAVGDELLRSKVVDVFDKPETSLPKIQQAVSEAGTDLGETLRVAESKGVKPASLDTIEKSVRKNAEDVLGTLKTLNQAGFGKVDAAMTDLRAYFGDMEPTLTKLHDFRSELDGAINWARKENPAAPMNPGIEGLLGVRRTIEGAIEDAMDSQAKAVGLPEDLLDIYKTQKLRYARLAVARDLVEDSVQRAAKNASMSLTDKMMAGAEIVGALAAGHPLAVLAAPVVGMASKLVRERGNSTAAVLLDKIADLSAVQRTVKTLDSRMSTNLERFIQGKPSQETVEKLSAADKDRLFDREYKTIKIASQDTEGVAKRTQEHLSTLVQSAPKVAQAFTRSIARAIMFLASKLPKASKDPISIQPQLDRKRPSETVLMPEKERFLRFVRAVNDPASVFTDLTRSQIDPEAVEAVRVVYPTFYADMKKRVADRLIDTKSALTQDQKLQLRRLFNQPADGTQTPGFIAAMQASFAPPKPHDQPGEMSAPKRPLEQFETSMKLKGFGGSVDKR